LTNVHQLDFVIVNGAFIWWELHATFPILFCRSFEEVLCLLDQEDLAASRRNLQRPDAPFTKVPWRGTQPAISSLAPDWAPQNMAVTVVTQKHRQVHSNRSWRGGWWPTPAISWLCSPKDIIFMTWDVNKTELNSTGAVVASIHGWSFLPLVDEMQDEIELQIRGRRVSTGAHSSTDLDQYKNQRMQQHLVHQTNTACVLEINTDSFFSAT
jgi:hypothetical protein